MARLRRSIDAYGITTRTLEVLRVADVTPGMRRVTMGGPQLAAHIAPNGNPVAAFRSDGFDDAIEVVLDRPDQPGTDRPTQGRGVVRWPRDGAHILSRAYTVRRWDAEAGEIDVDVVRRVGGPGTAWVQRVRPGDEIQIVGPKASAGHPEGVAWTLAAGDETALPAIGRWLEEWPEGARGRVFVEIGEDSHRQDLPIPEGVELTWLSRRGAAPGTAPLLLDAIRSAEWWDGTPYVWVAGEAAALASIRRWLRNDAGLPRDCVEVSRYWRRSASEGESDRGAQTRGRSGTLGQPGVWGPDAANGRLEAIYRKADIFPGFALRVAATIGLADALADGPRTARQIAERLGIDRSGAPKLLRYLESIGIVKARPGGAVEAGAADGTETTGTSDAAPGMVAYTLTELGRELEDERIAEALGLSNPDVVKEIGGMLSLAPAVAGKRSDDDVEHWFSAPFSDGAKHHPGILAEKVAQEAEQASYNAGSLAADPVFEGDSYVIVGGTGGIEYATALVEVYEDMLVVVMVSEYEQDEKQRSGSHPRIVFVDDPVEAVKAVFTHSMLTTGEPSKPDAIFFTNLSSPNDDESLAMVLGSAASTLAEGGHLLLLEDVLDPTAATGCDYEADLVEFSLGGGGIRTDDEFLAVFQQAGLRLRGRHAIGWGRTLFELEHVKKPDRSEEPDQTADA